MQAIQNKTYFQLEPLHIEQKLLVLLLFLKTNNKKGRRCIDIYDLRKVLLSNHLLFK